MPPVAPSTGSRRIAGNPLDAGKRAQPTPSTQFADEPAGRSHRQSRPVAGGVDRPPPGVPGEESGGIGADHAVLLEPGVARAHLVAGRGEDQPVSIGRPTVGEVEADHHPGARQGCRIDQPRQRPQHQVRIVVLGQDVSPAGAPDAERQADLGEFAAGFGEQVCRRPATGGALDDTVADQVVQPLRQHASRQTRCAVEYLAEPSAADEEVPQDDRGPALGEHLRAQRDRTVLAVALHATRALHPTSMPPHRFGW